MVPKGECYYVVLDLQGPESTYRRLYEVLKELRAERLEGGFPVWVFYGGADSHDEYRAKFESALPRTSMDRHDIRYGFLLMSESGYTAYGEYRNKTI